VERDRSTWGWGRRRGAATSEGGGGIQDLGLRRVSERRVPRGVGVKIRPGRARWSQWLTPRENLK
jgi:hypothetical protein